MSVLYDGIEQIVHEVAEREIKKAFEPGGKLDVTIREIMGLDLPDTAQMNRSQFTVAMARRLVAAGESKKSGTATAVLTLNEWLADEKIGFGDPDYDWSRLGANTLAEECAIQYWDQP